MKSLILGGLCMLLLSSCYYDRYEELYPLANYQDDCDTTLADTYNASISLVINNNCTSCHNKSTKNGNIDLSDYASVAGAANSGQLMGTIQHSPGYKKMPPYTDLRSCEIDRLQRWVQKNLPE